MIKEKTVSITISIRNITYYKNKRVGKLKFKKHDLINDGFDPNMT